MKRNMQAMLYSAAVLQLHRVDAPVMRQLKIDLFEINALKLQAVSHNTIRLIIPASTLDTMNQQ